MSKQKLLIKNYIFNVMLTMLNIIFPIITFPYVSRVLGAEGLGKISFVNSIVNYFLIFAVLGIPNYGLREIARYSKDDAKSSKVFSEIFTLGVLASFLVSALYYSMIFSFNAFHNDRLLYSICGLTLILNMFSIDWMYKGFEDYKYITLRSIAFKILSIIMLFLLVRSKSDYVIYAFISVVALSGANLINILIAKKHVKFNIKNLNLRRHITPILMLLSTEIAINIYVNLDSTMLGLISGNISVGYYTAAIKINKMVVPIVTSLGAVLLPRLSYYIKDNNREMFDKCITKSVQYVLFIALPATVGLFMLAPEIILLFSGDEFLPAVTAMRIATPTILFLGISNLTGMQILIPLGKEKYLFYSVAIAAVTNFILNLFFIPIFSQNGAALSTTIVEGLVIIIQWYFIKDYLKGKFFNKSNIKYILGSLGIMGIVYIVKLFSFGAITTIIISIPLSALFYIVFNFILKEPILILVFNKLKNKGGEGENEA